MRQREPLKDSTALFWLSGNAAGVVLALASAIPTINLVGVEHWSTVVTAALLVATGFGAGAAMAYRAHYAALRGYKYLYKKYRTATWACMFGTIMLSLIGLAGLIVAHQLHELAERSPASGEVPVTAPADLTSPQRQFALG